MWPVTAEEYDAMNSPAEDIPDVTLLPCPFCGSDVDGPCEWKPGYVTICCQNQACAAEITLPVPYVFSVTAWNSRIDR